MVSKLPSQQPIPAISAVGRLSLAVCVLLSIPVAAPTAAIEWALVDSSCAIPASVAAVSCGVLGTYLFAEPMPVLACNPDDGGISPDEVYLQPRAIPVTDVEPTTIGGLWDSGFRAKTGVPPDQARAVVIDWSDAHGAAVQMVLEQVAGGRVYADLYALDDRDLVAQLGSNINDAHLIANLCRLIEEISAGGVRPAVLNLSFGRHSAEDINADTCLGSLPCQIAKIFARFVSLGTMVTAAAGNHQDLLFPARLPDVLAVGTLDVAHFAAHRTAVPSWESPIDIDVLLPGDGVCANGDLPAGSSFAAPAAAGYLAALARDGFSISSGVGVWMPQKESECYVMSSGMSTMPGCVHGLDSFIEQTLSGIPCAANNGAGPAAGNAVGTGQTDAPPAPPLAATVGLDPTPVEMPAVPGYAAWQADSHHPTPGGDPCVPCMDGNSGGGGGGALRSKIGVMPLPGLDITLDLSGSGGLADSFQIIEVYLRVGSSFYRALMDDETLADLAAGAIDLLVLKRARRFVLADEQPSIVLVEWVDFNTNGVTDPGERFWTSSPVYLP